MAADNWKVVWKVLVDGQDMTTAMHPYLMDISVSDKAEASSDSCSLTFDDTDGQVRLPPVRARVLVFLQGVKVFEGITDVPRSKGNRGAGRTVSVSAKGFDAQGKAKQPQTFHADDANLESFLGQAAKSAGLSLSIDPAFGQITRDYWAADGESVLQLGQRMARELHGTFKIRGDKAVLAKRGEGKSPTGGAMPTITGAYGSNLIDWDISPRTPRHQFANAQVRYFDRETASVKTEQVDFDGEGGEASNLVRSHAADADQAKDIGEARKRESDREGGEGSVTIDIEPQAQAEGTFVLTGARAGIDGTYRIEGVDHRASRGGGATTALSLKQPGDGAGKDARKSKSSAASDDANFSLPTHETLG